jgi:hypothetical protein
LIVGMNHPSSSSTAGGGSSFSCSCHTLPILLVVGLPVAFVWQGREPPSLRPLDGPGREPPLLPIVGLGHELPPLQPLVGGVVSRPPLQPLDERMREPPPPAAHRFLSASSWAFYLSQFQQFWPCSLCDMAS